MESFCRAHLTGDRAKDALSKVSRILAAGDLLSLHRAASGGQNQNPKDAAARLMGKGLAE